MIRYAYGSKENLRAVVKDALGAITTLDRAFISVWSVNAAGQLVTKLIDEAPCGVDSMSIQYLLDTTTLGAGKFKALMEAEINRVNERPAAWLDITIDRKEAIT